MELSKEEKILASTIYHSLGPVITTQKLQNAYDKGMIAKADLVDGASYLGRCRNASVAKWNATTEKFTYIRTKFGSSFEEDIVHPENDEGYDIFVPIRAVEA